MGSGLQLPSGSEIIMRLLPLPLLCIVSVFLAVGISQKIPMRGILEDNMIYLDEEESLDYGDLELLEHEDEEDEEEDEEEEKREIGIDEDYDEEDCFEDTCSEEDYPGVKNTGLFGRVVKTLSY